VFKEDRKPQTGTKIHFVSAAMEGGYSPHYRAYYATHLEAQQALRDFGVWGVEARWEKASDYLRIQPQGEDPNTLREYAIHERITIGDTGLTVSDLAQFETLADCLEYLNDA